MSCPLPSPKLVLSGTYFCHAKFFEGKFFVWKFTQKKKKKKQGISIANEKYSNFKVTNRMTKSANITVKLMKVKAFLKLAEVALVT